MQTIFNKQNVAAALRRFASDDKAIHVQPISESGKSTNSLSSLDTKQHDPTRVVNKETIIETTNVVENAGVDKGAKEYGSSSKIDTYVDTKTEQVTETNFNRWPSIGLANWVSSGRFPGEDGDEEKEWLNKMIVSLQRALRGYDMTTEFVGSRLTPNAALIRFRGSDDLTVPKVEKRRQELLTSHAIEVINVLAAPREVVIMVARPSRAILCLRDLWRQRELPASTPKFNTSLLLGACETDGELLYLNVGEGYGGLQPHGPHTLIAGETGSGKGVLVQCLLLDICATNSPSNARIQMIDPKAGIDFPWLRKMPHLDGGLKTDREAAVDAMEALVVEMERRNHLLAAAGVTKLSNYNRKVEPHEQLARIWLFHDELADWMMDKEYREAVELNANRLGVKSRAAGINLVFVTQRPDKSALPMQLRANLSNRLVLKVADKKNSELVLDEAGAERLLGRGHLAAKLSGEAKIMLAQVPFIEEEEIIEVAEIIAGAWND